MTWIQALPTGPLCRRFGRVDDTSAPAIAALLDGFEQLGVGAALVARESRHVVDTNATFRALCGVANGTVWLGPLSDGPAPLLREECWNVGPDVARWLRLRVAAFSRAPEGGWLVTAEDVTSEHEARTRLERTCERLESALSSAGVATWDWNVPSGDACFSDEWARLRGLDPREVAPRADTWVEGLHPEDRERVLAEVERNLEGQTQGFVSEHRVRTASGGWRWIHDRGRVVARDASGRPLRMTGTEIDVTDRKIAEAALRDSERRLATLIANLPGAVVRCRNEPHWPVEFISDGIEALSGYTAVEFLAGLSLGKLIHPDDRSYVWTHVQQGLEAKRPYQIEYRVEHRDGAYRWWSEQGRGVFNPEGGLLAIEAFVTDITERKQSEAARQQLEAQLRQAQKLEAVGQLSGGIAHDFNNLLTVIMGHIGLLGTERHLTPEAVNSVAQISASATRAANLTRQLLAFSRRTHLEMTNLDLTVVAREALPLLRPLLGETIRLEFEGATEPLPLVADRTTLEQVIFNLALNARDAMPGGGTLTISTLAEPPATTRGTGPSGAGLSASRSGRPFSPSGAAAVLRVRDTGCGIPSAHLARIFEPFFTTKDLGKGTGLGLAIAYGIVRQHEGWIDVESRVGGGTVFDVHLPLRALPSADPVSAVPDASARASGEGVLLVEDEDPVRSIVGTLLRRAGYTVHEAGSGAEALALWRERSDEIRVLVTDMVMPGGVSGRELARQLLAERPQLPVIYMSGYSPDIHAGDMQLEAGLNFAAKPSDLRALPAMIARQLGR